MFISEVGCDFIVNLSVELLFDVMVGILIEVACFNEEIGMFLVNLVSVFNLFYIYVIGQGSLQVLFDFEGLFVGNYIVMIVDGSGCEMIFNGFVEVFEFLVVMVCWDILSCENLEFIVIVDIIFGEMFDLVFIWLDGLVEFDWVIGIVGIYDLEIDNGCEIFSESIMLVLFFMEG